MKRVVTCLALSCILLVPQGFTPIMAVEGDSTSVVSLRDDIQGGAGDGTIVNFGKFYNGIDKEDSFVNISYQ